MKKIITLIIIILGFSFINIPVYAAKKGDACTCADGRTGVVTVDTSILSSCDCDGGNKGGAITNTLKLVIDIMSIGIGILGVVGISVVGIQYLTAGGNEEKTKKAKRRLFEIVLGLVVYVAFAVLMNWLLIRE